MKYTVFLTDDAVQDLENVDSYISANDSIEAADYVLSMIEEVMDKLADLPDRGTYPKELTSLGIKEYRELFFKPYRVIYRIVENKVYIYVITDGRRDMQTLLSRRLLEA